MKRCVVCGEKIKEDAKFCLFCGDSQEGRKKERRPIKKSQSGGLQRRKVRQSSGGQASPQAEKIVNSSRNYLQYLNRNTVAPKLSAKGNDFNGVINLFLVALLMALGITHKNQSILNAIQSGVNTSPFPMFFEIFLWMFCAFMMQVVILFVFSNHICHRPLSFLGAVNQLFAPVSIAVYISGVIFLLSFLLTGVSLIYLFLALLPFLMIQLAFAASLWINSSKIKIRRLYIVFAAYVVSWLGAYLLMRIFLSLLASKIDVMDLLKSVL